MFFSPSLNWGNFIIILLIDLKLWYPGEPLFASTIFFSSFASNLLYLFGELPRQSTLPTFWDKDFRAGQWWDLPLNETQGGINLKLTNKMRPRSCLLILHFNCSTSYIMRSIAYMVIWHFRNHTQLTSRIKMLTDYSSCLYDLNGVVWQYNEECFNTFMQCHCGFGDSKVYGADDKCVAAVALMMLMIILCQQQ